MKKIKAALLILMLFGAVLSFSFTMSYADYDESEDVTIEDPTQIPAP